MKKSFKIFGTLVAIAALSFFLYSCNDEDDFVPGDPELEDCYGVYFPTQPDPTTGLEIDPADPKELTIVVAREDANGAITVPYEINPDYDGIFTASELTFANGQSETTITLYFDNAEIGVQYDLAVEITDPQYASVYSSNVPGCDVSLAVVKWNSLTETEKALYTDDIFTTFYSVGNLTWEVDVEERDDMPGMYRVVYPYDEKYAWNDPGDWDTSKTYYMTIDATDPDGVYMEQQEIGVDWGYGMISIMSYGWYYYINGYTWDTIKANDICGTYKTGVITFPVQGILVNMPEYSSGWYYANTSGAFKLKLPGAIEPDYSVTVDSAVVDGFDVTATVTLGEDVESARVALVAGKDGADAASKVEKGSVDYQEITASGEVSFTAETGGNFCVVAVTYGGGEAQESDYATVKIADPNETWSHYGYGDYHYGDVLFSGDDPGLEIFQSDSDEDRFKIEHWGYDVDFIFTWDQDTNEVVVEDQQTGYTYSFYGMTYIDDVSDYYGIGSSTYSGGTFYFAVAYYCGAGDFGFGVETFTLTDGTMYSMSDLVGTYYVDGISYFGEDYDVEGYRWTIAESDDPDWDIMLTYFNGWKCDSPLYGNFDASTGVFTIYSGTTGQYFYNYYNTYDIYFVSYNALYYSRYGYDSGEFQLLPNGTFVGPLEADWVGEYLYGYGTGADVGWNQLFVFVYGEKYSSATSSTSNEGVREAKPITNKVDYTPLALQKVKIDATVKVGDKTSSDEGNSSKFSKKTLKNAVPVAPSF